VETLVALLIGTLLVLLAHQLFAAVADRAKTLVAARTALDRATNARRWLEATFLSLDVGTDGASGFDGGPDHVAFTTWLLTPDGWFERRQVALERRDDRLVATGAQREPIALMESLTEVQLDYLLEPGADSRWVRMWVSPVTAPLAVRLRVARTGCERGHAICVDTLLFLVKERG
jgi:hypothetical protein